jgi:hypothetical protein
MFFTPLSSYSQVGCTSLRAEHVFLDVGENKLRLKFLGKDSIEYDATTEVRRRNSTPRRSPRPLTPLILQYPSCTSPLRP